MHYVSHDGDQLTTMASHIVMVIGAMIMVLVCWSCAQTQLSIEQRAVLIERLKMAKKQDEDNIRDSATDSAEVRDSFQQAHKADHAIRELRNGFYVDRDEICDALEVPPKTFSKEQIAELIEKLKQAKRESKRDAEVNAEDDNLVASDLYQEHEEEVDGVIEDLEIGEDVPWSRIKEAMHVPQNL
jgi:hypothetical protein